MCVTADIPYSRERTRPSESISDAIGKSGAPSATLAQVRREASKRFSEKKTSKITISLRHAVPTFQPMVAGRIAEAPPKRRSPARGSQPLPVAARFARASGISDMLVPSNTAARLRSPALGSVLSLARLDVQRAHHLVERVDIARRGRSEREITARREKRHGAERHDRREAACSPPGSGLIADTLHIFVSPTLGTQVASHVHQDRSAQARARTPKSAK
jgi:hypothetical protein